MARERIEDLGRIYEILTNILEAKLFEPDFLNYLEKDELKEKLDDIAFEIEAVNSQVSAAWEIASGQDCLQGD